MSFLKIIPEKNSYRILMNHITLYSSAESITFFFPLNKVTWHSTITNVFFSLLKNAFRVILGDIIVNRTFHILGQCQITVMCLGGKFRYVLLSDFSHALDPLIKIRVFLLRTNTKFFWREITVLFFFYTLIKRFGKYWLKIVFFNISFINDFRGFLR